MPLLLMCALVVLSTDKAVYPITMGISKAMAEKLMLAAVYNKMARPFCATRYGNDGIARISYPPIC